MRTIVEGKETVRRLMGIQNVKNTRYRIMNYVLKADYEDSVLLLNVITGQMVYLTNAEKELILNLPNDHLDAMDDLIKHYFLVPLQFNEKEIVQKLRVLINRLFAPKGINGYTILTTTNCNARCFYCYQAGYAHINLKESTASNLLNYMIDHHETENTLKLHWFGGEPLIGVDRIDQICEGLKSYGINYVSAMITNGYLFTEEIVKRACTSWNLKSVQITLDGTETVYNKTKAYINPDGSPFKRVLNNIQLLLAYGIRVLIRLNLDMHNYDDLKTLIDDLHLRFKKQNGIEVYVHVLFENEGKTPIERNDTITRKLFERMVELNTYIQKLGLSNIQNELPSLKIHSCMADRNGTVMVLPNGSLCKCEHNSIKDQFGHITKGITDQSKIEKYKQLYELDSCKTCELYPSCVILKECNGVEDFNKYTCSYKRNSYRNNMIRSYIKLKYRST